jgi:hypothetical protein
MPPGFALRPRRRHAVRQAAGGSGGAAAKCLPAPAPFTGVDDCVVQRGNTSAGVAGCLTGVDPGTGRPVVALVDVLDRLAAGDLDKVMQRRNGVRAATGLAIAALITTVLAPLIWLALQFAFRAPTVLTLWFVGAVTAVPIAVALLAVHRNLTDGKLQEVVTTAGSTAISRAITLDPLSVYIVGGPGFLTREMLHIAGAALLAVYGPLIVAALVDPRDVAAGVRGASRRGLPH